MVEKTSGEGLSRKEKRHDSRAAVVQQHDGDDQGQTKWVIVRGVAQDDIEQVGKLGLDTVRIWGRGRGKRECGGW